MNVLIIKEENIFDKKIDDICNYYNDNNLNENIKFLYDKKTRLKIDIILVFSNNIDFIEEEFKNYKKNENILVFTNNFEPKHIISCLILTENLFSIRKSEEYILNKIIDVYNNIKRGKKVEVNA